LLSKHNLQQKSALLSMSNANIAIARRFLDELWNERKFEVADEIFSEDFVTHSISNEPPIWEGKGPNSMKKHIEHWLLSVPDMRFIAHHLIADDQQVVIHWMATGTHKGDWMGIPATGKTLQLLGVTISRVEDGKITQNMTIVDSLGLLQQLEVLPDSATILSQAH
jgi:steroid delta-isomerase-like uncharacterized protein